MPAEAGARLPRLEIQRSRPWAERKFASWAPATGALGRPGLAANEGRGGEKREREQRVQKRKAGEGLGILVGGRRKL